MTTAQNLDLASSGPAPGIAEGWNLYGRRSGSPISAAFGARARTQLANPSSLSSSPWALTGLTVAVGAETAPDGGPADVVYETAANVEHRASIALSGGTALSSRQYVFGAYIKAVGTTVFGGISYAGTASAGAAIDLSTGRFRLFPLAGSDIAKISGYALDVGNGWYRVSIYFELVSPPASTVVSVRPGSALGAYLGSATNGLAIWGAYLEEGAQRGFEAFEDGWSSNQNYARIVQSAAFADFDTLLIADPIHAFEDFEHGWLNHPFSTHELIERAIFNEGGTPVVFESFEHGWPDYTQALAPHITARTAALFGIDDLDQESFEDGWNNTFYSPTIGAQTAALFGLDLDAFEAFEDVVLDRQVVVYSDVVLVSPAHGLANGTAGYLRPQVGGVQVANTYANVRYFVIDGDGDPDRFSLSLTEGGGPVSFLDGGVGDQFFEGDPTRYWTSADGDPLI